ncbi:hypothetical protein [Leifsonia sp. Leaf264]|uniref:hypothetical protein n=1 Tax=Leifsonia sp. Leaf264 TaxID=1736314 RepID=UPI0006FD1D0A|nr:hypothetical protein [Leifsonia sp. Leaf264]KQO98474.1 hypothetical protein ASF30_10455 [Leifsonia sp. Leaf264]
MAYIEGKDVRVDDVLCNATGAKYTVTKVQAIGGARKVFYHHPAKKNASFLIPNEARTRVAVPRPDVVQPV